MARKRNHGGVPYDALKRAVKQGEEDYPDADKIEPVWTNGKVGVMVWKDGSAKFVMMDEHPAS